MIVKYLSKFVLEILPSVVATIIGAYIVNHYIVAKPATDAPVTAAVSTVDPKAADPKAAEPLITSRLDIIFRIEAPNQALPSNAE